MTEYMEPASVTRLIGAPPGYVGHEEGGTLTERVRRRPYCVVLLDELEKAHRDVTGLLLQILEDGILTDSLGRAVDFKNTMIVMTSNLGSRESGRGGLGFTPPDAQDRTHRLLREAFPVELLGRIDCITMFRRLGADDLETIARRQLEKTARRAEAQGIRLTFRESVAGWLAARCLREDTGARSLRHLIQEQVESALAERLLTKDEARDYFVDIREDAVRISEALPAGK